MNFWNKRQDTGFKLRLPTSAVKGEILTSDLTPAPKREYNAKEGGGNMALIRALLYIIGLPLIIIAELTKLGK